MRVVLLGLSPSIGMQFYSAGLANALVNESGYKVWVIGSAALRKNAFDKRVRLLPTYSFSGTGLSLPALNLFNFRGLLKQIDDACPSLIHIIGPHLWNLPLALCLRGRYPLVFTWHDATVHQGTRGAQLKNAYQRAMARVVDCIVVHSRAVERALEENWGILPTAISVVPLVHHNFDYDLYQKIRASRHGVFSYENMALLFGRLEEYKGVREFLDAARVLGTFDDLRIKMVVAGSGSLSKELNKYERLPGLKIRNYLIEDDETIELFSRAGLFVLPYSEGSQSAVIPLAYLFQKPVLVTRVGGLPEYVRDGVTGRVIDSNDPALLARAIHDMISKKEALVQMGKAGKDYLLELEQQFTCRLLDAYTAATQGEAR